MSDHMKTIVKASVIIALVALAVAMGYDTAVGKREAYQRGVDDCVFGKAKKEQSESEIKWIKEDIKFNYASQSAIMAAHRDKLLELSARLERIEAQLGEVKP